MSNKWLSYARLNVVIYFMIGMLTLFVLLATGEFRAYFRGNLIELTVFFGLSALNVMSSLHIAFRLKRQQNICVLSKVLVTLSFVGIIIATFFHGNPGNFGSDIFNPKR